MSERRACRLVNQPRGTQRYQLTQRENEDALTQAIVELASQYGRYGYRRITTVLKRDGWQVGKDRVERIWRREGLKVPQRQKPRGRLWFNDGSCVRLRPEHVNHVWSSPRVRRQGPAEVAGRYGSEDSLYRAGKPMGERLL
jgi:transposase InsO family protein